ncbi:MAG: division/cell wall cluster transcriptional repressor MraZ [Candidatus Nealsonbacteria bacterium]|nr:MAG: division/cell wall cluster transcriptional repressor MraZ [Candidatus Nealsonbacteria bacterium]
MFIGEYSYIIDHKKRLSIPSKFRKSLGKKAVITRGLDNCLVVYPINEWQKVSEKLENLPSSKIDARGFSRIILSGAVDVNLDKLGRILIPDYLKKYAGLKKDVVIIGLSNKIEIWDEKTWKDYRQKTEKEIGDMAGRLEELGI